MQIDKKEIEEQINRKIELGTKQFGKDFKFLVIEILSLEKMLNPIQTEKQQSRLIPLVKWNDYYPDPSVKALRMLCFYKDKNGFENVIVKRGHRILIDEQKFFEWQSNQAVQ